MRFTLLTGVFALIAGVSALPQQELRDESIQGRTGVVSKEQPDTNITTVLYPRKTTQPEHVDTINNTVGVYSTSQIKNTKLRTFCPTNSKTQELCHSLRALVNFCIDEQAECSVDEARELLNAAIKSKPCNRATQGRLVNRLCYNWWRAARNCLKWGRRVQCGHHHVLFLLKEFRDLLALPDGPEPDGTRHSTRSM